MCKELSRCHPFQFTDNLYAGFWEFGVSDKWLPVHVGDARLCVGLRDLKCFPGLCLSCPEMLVSYSIARADQAVWQPQ